MNRLMNDFNSLKNNILNNGKGNKTNQRPRSQPIWLRNDRTKCQVMFNTLKFKSSSEWYLDSGYSRHMTGDRTNFTSLKNYNSKTITFGDGSLARVKGNGSIVILGCPILDGVLYFEGLKANLLSIS
ncbi:hypothetical protein AAG906_035549 [Vitis piasezkii]